MPFMTHGHGDLGDFGHVVDRFSSAILGGPECAFDPTSLGQILGLPKPMTQPTAL
jgi:hypothetical protein